MNSPPKISAVVLAWNEEPFLRRCVQALLGSEDAIVDVILVDNGCTTDDVAALAELPQVSVIRPGTNLGFSGGCNTGAAAATGDYLALVGSDAIVTPRVLARLHEQLQRPDVGIAAAAIRLADQPDLLNSSGNLIHVLGVSWVGGMGQPDTRTSPTDVAGAMGTCVLMRREHWERLGGFDAEYFAYFEDAEISLRTWRLGQRVVNVPDAIVHHRYEFARNSFKFYLIERNRLMFVLTLWGWRALLLLAPPLLALETAMLLLALKQGWLREKTRGYGWLWAHRRHVRQRRRQLQAERVVPDRQWMPRLLTDTFDTPLIPLPPGILKVLNASMRAYWAVVRRGV
ncbi:glycosyltransferase family 2 protein [Allorhizocola rhizosphaerae]|uniref:glycosyltransferase family 2 protein n=1 Tax=Allorhizocola rhizosphaerae TaxID=1872709 RepID=UPI000E3E6CE0|nr:glycosyltransferase family 2 protein [Allorhizocola rhizosphaerae]